MLQGPEADGEPWFYLGAIVKEIQEKYLNDLACQEPVPEAATGGVL